MRATFLVVPLLFVSAQTPWLYAADKDAPRLPAKVIRATGLGAIDLPSPKEWKFYDIKLYDEGTRPVITVQRGDVLASYIFAEAGKQDPTSDYCRTDTISAIKEHLGKDIHDEKVSDVRNKAGQTIAMTEYVLISAMQGHQVSLRNVFGFVGGGDVCAEIHVSSVNLNDATAARLREMVLAFQPDMHYQPDTMDYMMSALAFFQNSPPTAIPYLQATNRTLPPRDQFLDARRATTNMLILSNAAAGKISEVRRLAESAIAGDPDYPTNYYNLARADAVSGDTESARKHLQQAFDRKANLPTGEPIPNPAKDNAFSKLKSNKEFWTFVQALH